ncbi:ABC transporter substrate-binding protein [Pseudooceanicola aestuarii]|uniref:ABC transporter substrate-binding protein n=1 Tax=Pseudooceanicola aestuarii TaxID=2697319 RepID=UPI0013D39644|nr:ABC transporter substrate-binding protein [Pseudooceanicola aestuarii]
MSDKITIAATRHSAFYSPIHAVIAGGFLEDEGIAAEYCVAPPAQCTERLLDGTVQIAQSAVSASWDERERGQVLPLRHFCTINRRDGFFIVGRDTGATFSWDRMAGADALVDHGRQPYVGFCHAAQSQGIDHGAINLMDVGGEPDILAAFREGQGDFAHLQGPAAQQLEIEGHGRVVASCGTASGLFAFSSLRATQDFLNTDVAVRFTRAYAKARDWVASQPVENVTQLISKVFPDIGTDELRAAVRAYQHVGTWLGPVEIDDESYAAAHAAFTQAGRNTTDHRKAEVVAAPPA